MAKAIRGDLEKAQSSIAELQGQHGRLTSADLHSLAASVTAAWREDFGPDSLSVRLETLSELKSAGVSGPNAGWNIASPRCRILRIIQFHTDLVLSHA